MRECQPSLAYNEGYSNQEEKSQRWFAAIKWVSLEILLNWSPCILTLMGKLTFIRLSNTILWLKNRSLYTLKTTFWNTERTFKSYHNFMKFSQLTSVFFKIKLQSNANKAIEIALWNTFIVFIPFETICKISVHANVVKVDYEEKVNVLVLQIRKYICKGNVTVQLT